MRRRIIALLPFVFLGTAALASAQGSTSGLEAKVHELLMLTGQADQALQSIDMMIETMKKTSTEVPEEFWTEFRKELDAEGLVKLITPIYIKYLTEEEIDAMLTFYRSKAGKSIVQKLPLISQEAMLAGQEWGRQLGMLIYQRLIEEGYGG